MARKIELRKASRSPARLGQDILHAAPTMGQRDFMRKFDISKIADFLMDVANLSPMPEAAEMLAQHFALGGQARAQTQKSAINRRRSAGAARAACF
jgi:hypothetical protein